MFICKKMMKNLFLSILFLKISLHAVSAQSLDLRLLEKINGPLSPADKSWRFVSNSVYVTFAAVPATMLITGFINHDRDLTIKSFETGGSILIAEGATVVLKQLTHRQRPYIAYPNLIVGKTNETDYSFPSGHTSIAFATATSLTLSFHKWYVVVPAYAYAATVGYSRMYLGVHYPSDVLGGALVGAGSSLLTWELQRLLNKKYHYN